MNQLKPVLIAIAIAATPSLAAAQGVPEAITFTARLADNGTPVSGPHTFRFELFDAATGGARVWSEPASGEVTVTIGADGLLLRELGSDVALDSTVLDGRPLYLEVSVDGTTLSPRTPIVSVPYAVRSDVAASAELLGTLAPADVALAGHNHDGVYLPVGATLSCPADQQVTGIVAATGNVVCAPDTATNWTDLQAYPAACGAGTAVTAVNDTLTCAPFDSTPDTIADDGVISDAEASDLLTIAAGGSVTWAALTGYPGGCAAGSAIAGLGDTVTCTQLDSTPDTIADDGSISDSEVDNDISIANGALFASSGGTRVGINVSPSGLFQALGLTAAADASADSVSFSLGAGGVDGADANDLGGQGGGFSVVTGNGGAGRNSGGIGLTVPSAGAATGTAAAGAGGSVQLTAGFGGSSTNANDAGAGGNVNLTAGGGGTNSTTGGTDGNGGSIVLTPGGATGNGSLGAVDIGGTTTAASNAGGVVIKAHIVGGDLDLTDDASGIILRRADSTCYRVTMNTTGIPQLVASPWPCP